ncbi:hypothetical protein [Planosporangium mesophilum]|uniref:Uncharacterized protein n=1 Tax=Planosporangium mesophilum TaxID=689768 RepID=A0A8J3X119_9ACTN|nr:hypothetical protein [Planosporangium mesophilum]NJC84650.1 hypothetical protein [Planosporangium mesophilum]GII23960.1 hypothetical protein Pme01_35570 [Planosporangium mesophilum]
MTSVRPGRAAGTAPPAAARRMSARDRGWLSVDNLRTIGPLHGVTAEGLRAALVRLHEAHPTHQAVCRMDREAARWIPLSRSGFAAFSRSLAVRVDGTGTVHPADAVTRWLVDEPLGDRPLLLAVGGGYVGAKMSHALGDGRIVNTLFPELMRAAARGRAPRLPFPTPVRLPVVRAALHHFGRNPSRLLSAAKILRPPASPADADAGTEAPAPWRPDIAYGTARSATAPARARTWRDRHAPGVSAAAVLFAGASAALIHCGLTPKWPGLVVLFDARRYLPAGSTVDGNFAWGQYLLPADLTDPRAVHESLAEEFASGRPLAMLALRTARLALSRTRHEPPALRPVAADPRPELTLTHIGRISEYVDLPWAGPPEEWRNMSVPTTGGPEALTMSFSELGGALYMNVSFDRAVFDPAPVRRAIDLICEDPVGLINTPA